MTGLGGHYALWAPPTLTPVDNKLQHRPGLAYLALALVAYVARKSFSQIFFVCEYARHC